MESGFASELTSSTMEEALVVVSSISCDVEARSISSSITNTLESF